MLITTNAIPIMRKAGPPPLIVEMVPAIIMSIAAIRKSIAAVL